jgi:hypothetical protein
VRLSVHLRTWQQTGSAQLSPERKAKLENMLLLTHGVVAAASAGKVAVSWQAEGPVALRHLNVAVLSEVGRYAVPVMVRYVRRDDPALKFDRNERELSAGWDQLLADDGFMGAIQAFETAATTSHPLSKNPPEQVRASGAGCQTTLSRQTSASGHSGEYGLGRPSRAVILE